MADAVNFFVKNANDYFVPKALQADQQRIDDVSQKIFDALIIFSAAAPLIFANSNYIFKKGPLPLLVLVGFSQCAKLYFSRLNQAVVKELEATNPSPIEDKTNRIFINVFRSLHAETAYWLGLSLGSCVVVIISFTSKNPIFSSIILGIALITLLFTYYAYQNLKHFNHHSHTFRDQLKLGLETMPTLGDDANRTFMHWQIALNSSSASFVKQVLKDDEAYWKSRLATEQLFVKHDSTIEGRDKTAPSSVDPEPSED